METCLQQSHPAISFLKPFTVQNTTKNELFEILKYWPCFPIFHGSTSKIDIPALFLKRKNLPLISSKQK